MRLFLHLNSLCKLDKRNKNRKKPEYHEKSHHRQLFSASCLWMKDGFKHVDFPKVKLTHLKLRILLYFSIVS